VLVRESGLFNSNKHADRSGTYTEDLLSWKQDCMSCWFQTALESIGVSGRTFVDCYPPDMWNTSCGPQIKLTIPGPNIKMLCLWAKSQPVHSFHILILSEFICLPTDAQLNCLKNSFKICIKIDFKTAPTWFGVIAIITESTIRSC